MSPAASAGAFELSNYFDLACIPFLRVPSSRHFAHENGKITSRTGGVSGSMILVFCRQMSRHIDSPVSAAKGERRKDGSRKVAFATHAGVSLSILCTGVSAEGRAAMKRAGLPAPYAQFSERTARRILHYLADEGLIEIEARPGRPNLYRFIIGAWKKLAGRVTARGQGAWRGLKKMLGNIRGTVTPEEASKPRTTLEEDAAQMVPEITERR
ncbi:hypothetical protein LCGC14_2450860, partial [marine sediment metagenome]